MSPSNRKESLIKPVIKGVVGAGAVAVLTTGVMGMSPVLALPIATAGVVYAKMKAKNEAPSQSNAKVWGVIAGVGVAVAAVTNTLDMVPGFASASFVVASAAPFAVNRLRDRLSGRRQAQSADASVLHGHNGPRLSSGEPTVSDRPAPQPITPPADLVNMAIPASMAEKVAQFVETLQATPENPPAPQPARSTLRPG